MRPRKMSPTALFGMWYYCVVEGDPNIPDRGNDKDRGKSRVLPSKGLEFCHSFAAEKTAEAFTKEGLLWDWYLDIPSMYYFLLNIPLLPLTL